MARKRGYDRADDRSDRIGGQIAEEWNTWVGLVEVYKPKTYLEIGCREGAALKYLVEHVPSLEHITAVDLPGARWGWDESHVALKANLVGTGVPYTLHLGDSHSPMVIEEVSRRRYDVLFIDGDHTYDGVKQDYETYSPLIDVVIGMHDVNCEEGKGAHGVNVFWNELDKGPHWRKISRDGSHAGIGVIRL